MKKEKTISDITGVYGSAVAAGIKAEGLDLSYISVPDAVASAGVYTKNAFAAPCVLHNQKVFADRTVKAIVVNSGNANAVTGLEGKKNVARTAEMAAEFLTLSPEEIAIASTGIIGEQLPMEKMETGLKALLSNPTAKDGTLVAEGILTTDTCTKSCFYEKNLNGKVLQVAGVAKGSGMIAPNMATMLSFLVTNVAVSSELLQQELTEAVDSSFNMISVDSDTSTSDMVLCLASGDVSIDDTARGEELQAFIDLLQEACRDLALQIVADGEGSQRIIEVNVLEARSKADAKAIAKSVIDSPLVKTAVHGADPNWGRILMAVGKVEDVLVEPEKVAVTFQGVAVLEAGAPVAFDRPALAKQMAAPRVVIDIRLGLGEGESSAWGCELTKGYIDINTCYN